jgi:phosphoglycerate dehydrogenase-like enzyme
MVASLPIPNARVCAYRTSTSRASCLSDQIAGPERLDTVTRVAVLDDYQRRASGYADWSALGAAAELKFFAEPMTQEQLPRALAEFEVLVLMRERTHFRRDVLEQLPRLQLLVTTGMRNAAVDIAYLNERGVTVCGTEGMGGVGSAGVPSTAEVAWALVLAVAKRVTVEDRALRSGAWQVGIPTNLAGATLGLAGLGNLGAAMVGPARAFGMDVVAWSQNLSQERADALGVRRVPRDELLATSDFLSIHLVLSDRTRGLFGGPELAQMKPSAVLVNTSRGPIVDAAALVAALRAGTISAAGLDVYDQEPLPAGDELTTLENVVLLPHLGYVSEPGLRHMYEQVVQDIAAFIGGAPIPRHRLIAPDVGALQCVLPPPPEEGARHAAGSQAHRRRPDRVPERFHLGGRRTARRGGRRHGADRHAGEHAAPGASRT